MGNYHQAVRANAVSIANMSDPELRNVRSVLESARNDTARGLKEWLKKIPPQERDQKYTIHAHRALLGELDDALDTIKSKLGLAVGKDLKKEIAHGNMLSVAQLKSVMKASERKFRDSVQPLRLDLVKQVLRKNSMLTERHGSGATKFADRAQMVIKNEMAVGLSKNESVDQIARRLTGRLKSQYDKMSDAEKGAAAGDRFLLKTKYDAERLVRTEIVHAANRSQIELLRAQNEENDEDREASGGGGDDSSDDTGGGGDDPWMKRWDASIDGQTCDECAELDNVIVDIDDVFPGGVDHPPLHPNCRCAVTPWRASWGE